MSSKLLVVFLFLCTVSWNEAEKAAVKGKNRALVNKFEDDGKFVFVFDKLFPRQVLSACLQMISQGKIEGMLSPWQYAYKDYYFNIQVANSTNNLPWITPMSPDLLMKTAVWEKINKVAKAVSGGKVYYPYHITSSMVKRLDFITVDTVEDADNDELIFKVFLTPNIKKNDYGEVLFYKQNGEILGAVFPKLGRLLVWNASVPFIYKPPAMSFRQGLYDITVRLTTSKEKFELGTKKSKEYIEEDAIYEKMDFPLTDGMPLPDMDFEKHLTRKFHDRKGRVVAYFDGLVAKGDLDALRLFLLHYNSAYAYQGYDESADTEHDNVSWIAGIKVAKFVKSRLWQIIQSAVEYLSGGNKGWYPYDVSMNIVRNSHYTRIHEDCEEDEYEFTILLYLTPEWDEEKYGETVFFNEVMQPNGRPFRKGHQQYNWVASVKPVYGRLVVFRGIIPHSARPPSPGFKGARYTFACKVSRTYHIAHAKMLRESIEDVEPGHPDAKLMEDLTYKLYDIPTPERPTEFLEKELAKRRKEKADSQKQEKMSILDEVITNVS